MPPSTPDDSLLLIRCPSCGQRFKVGEDLRERTVECGGCEHRFRINEEVIVRGRKFYPSERKDPGLSRFSRMPLAGGEARAGAQPARYGELPDPAVLSPASPQRIMAGVIGVGAMVVMALFLMLGNSRGGMLDGMVFANRLLMGGFTCLLGTVMLVYANPRARLKSLTVGLLLSCGVLAVPYYFRDGSVPLPSRSLASQPGEKPEPAVDKPVAEGSALLELRTRIGTGPLVAEIERLSQRGGTEQAMGVWLRGLSDSDRFLVRDYMLRVTGADSSSHFYPRSGGDYLLVLSGIRISLQELATVAAVLGSVEKIYPEISVVEIRVKDEVFVEGAMDKLTKKGEPAFYELNKRELESIDFERVKRAVQRLAEAEPNLYRTDISRKLISLLGEDTVEFKANICSALLVWSEQPGPAGEAALAELHKLLASGKAVPPEIVALIVKEKNPAIIPILDELWFKNPMSWESIYGDLGPAIEGTVLRRFPETKGTIRYSAVRLLGKVGGTDSLPILTAAEAGADSELRVLLDQAQKSIRSRAGQ